MSVWLTLFLTVSMQYGALTNCLSIVCSMKEKRNLLTYPTWKSKVLLHQVQPDARVQSLSSGV